MVVAAVTGSAPLLFVALFVYGAGTATNLQARYAGADLADARHRGRAVSTVLVATTVGGVVGPNLAAPTGVLAEAIGVPRLAGPFLLAGVAYGAGALILAVWLRPDPLLLARRIEERRLREAEVMGGSVTGDPAAGDLVTGAAEADVSGAADAAGSGAAGAMGSGAADATGSGAADAARSTGSRAAGAARSEATAGDAADADAADGPPPFRGGVQLGAGIMALAQLVMVAIMTMTPVHMQDHGHTTAASGLVIALHVGAMFLPSPLTGMLVDRFGRLWIASASGLVLLAAGALAAAAPPSSVPLLALALVLLGLGWNLGLISGTALVTDSVALATRARTQGSVDVGIAASGAVGGMTSGFVVAGAGYPVLAATGGALALALLPAAALAARARAR